MAAKTSPTGNASGNDVRRLEELDRLEELLEEMDELGVTTRSEIEARLASLEAQIADIDAASPATG